MITCYLLVNLLKDARVLLTNPWIIGLGLDHVLKFLSSAVLFIDGSATEPVTIIQTFIRCSMLNCQCVATPPCTWQCWRHPYFSNSIKLPSGLGLSIGTKNSDLEQPLLTPLHKTCVLKPTTEIGMKIDPHWRQQRRNTMTMVSYNIMFMQIFTGIPWRGGVKRQWGDRTLHLRK